MYNIVDAPSRLDENCEKGLTRLDDQERNELIPVAPPYGATGISSFRILNTSFRTLLSKPVNPLI
jgi:hypothetical protein